MKQFSIIDDDVVSLASSPAEPPTTPIRSKIAAAVSGNVAVVHGDATSPSTPLDKIRWRRSPSWRTNTSPSLESVDSDVTLILGAPVPAKILKQMEMNKSDENDTMGNSKHDGIDGDDEHDELKLLSSPHPKTLEPSPHVSKMHPTDDAFEPEMHGATHGVLQPVSIKNMIQKTQSIQNKSCGVQKWHMKGKLSNQLQINQFAKKQVALLTQQDQKDQKAFGSEASASSEL